MEAIVKTILDYIPSGIVTLFCIALLILNSWLFRNLKHKPGISYYKGTVSILLVLFGLIIFILFLPIDQGFKGTILGFFGIIISAGIALSSPTVLGNILAGIMNNSMNRFKNGDLIQINEIQGRVIKKGIFHTEIQLEDSNFITIPNLFMSAHPVKLTRSKNTVISASVSLGYDISRQRITGCLKEAAQNTGLKDPFVHITSLGDFSVVYKIHGFLEDSSQFFTKQSQLKGEVMDVLHNHQIEIVSPSFMNQRQVNEQIFISDNDRIMPTPPEESDSNEDKVFDKAIKSMKIEKLRELLNELSAQQSVLKETQKKDKSEKIKLKLVQLESQIKRLKKFISEQDNKAAHD